MRNSELIDLLSIAEKHIDPTSYPEDSGELSIFEMLDDELARRVSEGSLEAAEAAEVLKIMCEHNMECPQGYEICLEMFLSEAQETMIEAFPSLSKPEFILAAGGYAASGALGSYPDTINQIEKNLKERI